MGSEWKEYPISEVCDLIVDCVNKTAPKVDFVTPYKMLRTTNVKNGKIDTYDCFFVSEEVFEKWTRRAKLLIGDVLLTREAPLGEVGMVMSNENLFLGQRLMQYRSNPHVLDSRFLLYSFLSPYMQAQFKMHEGSGSVVSHIRVPDCSKFQIKLPPLPIQKSIAHILGSLDDKIELNRRMNQTLEQMAQALFKSWFVDFDPVIDNALAAGNPIPDELQERAQARQALGDKRKPLPVNVQQLFPCEFEYSEVLEKWVPMGWRCLPLSEFISIKHGYAFKGEFFTDSPTSDILLTPGNFKIGGGFKRDKLKYYNGDVPSGYVLSESDLIVTMTDLSKEGDTLGYAALVPNDVNLRFLHNQRIGKVEFTERKLGLHFLYLTMCSKKYKDEILATATGTTVKHTSPTRIVAYQFLFSSMEIIDSFGNICANFFDRIAMNDSMYYNLQEVRDTLLPKLIAGELDIQKLLKYEIA